jgi:hypothetical protein
VKYIWLLFFCAAIAAGCSSNRKPQGLLSEDEMVKILIDIHLTEGFVQSLPIPYDSSKRLYPVLEKEIFEKHEVPDSVYINSLQYYLRDAVFMERLYARTVDSLSVMEKRADQ